MPPHHRHAVHAGEHVVCDNQLAAGARQRKSGFAVGGDEDFPLSGRQHRRERLRLDRIVLHDEDPRPLTLGNAHHGAPGSATVKVVPSPSLLFTRISPPCSRVIWRLIPSPRPLPYPFPARKNGVKIFPISSEEMPGPRSMTMTCALGRAGWDAAAGGTPSTSRRGCGFAGRNRAPAARRTPTRRPPPGNLMSLSPTFS